MTASGAGALVGALYLASRPSVVGLGRVMAFYTMAFLGTAPIGSLLGGVLAAYRSGVTILTNTTASKNVGNSSGVSNSCGANGE